jgi:glycosyltransferase involved in cell wall biosynthesis
MPNDMHTDDSPGSGEIARLAAENAALRARLARAETSAHVQAMRAAARGWDAGIAWRQVQIIRRSLFWRVTAPLRIAVDLARGAPDTGSPEAVLLRRLAATIAKDGVGAAWEAASRGLRQKRRQQSAERSAVRAKAAKASRTGKAAVAAAAGAGGATPGPRAAAAVLAPCVVIVADLVLPQCAKYRVWQKQEHFMRLGVACHVVDWRDIHAARSAAALATQAILYRVPATKEVLELIGLLDVLGVPAAWEVDDLIFDQALYRQNSNLADLDKDEQEELLDGAALNRAAMLRIGRGIASTPGLADAMRQAGLTDVAVVENALDSETLQEAAAVRADRARRQPRDAVVIAYGSGTRTHDADFRLVAPALAQLMKARPNVRLRIVGDLTLPPAIAAFGDRVEPVRTVAFPVYLRLLGDADISIAPLEASVFNDAKSCIKFLEAAILGVPSVCSPRAAFADAVTDGVNGLLADSDAAWFEALDRLAGDPALRTRLGEAALATALERFAPERIARHAVAPLLVADQRGPEPALRVLFANVYFAPRSYGGATFVVEQMAEKLAADPAVEVHVVTTTDFGELSLERTAQGRKQIFAMPVPSGDAVGDFDNPEAGDTFGRILDAVQPHVVHLHAMQQLSGSAADACRVRGIPYVITLHDAWWLCARQFMVKGDGHYCFQTRIDLHICQACNPGAKHLEHRQRLLRDALDGAALLLSPSEAHRSLYLAQGIAPERIEVAPNGIVLPHGEPARPKSGRLRFGYVGGPDAVKGFEVLQGAMESLQRADWELVLVDNTLNLGFSSMDTAEWRVRGELKVVPAYSQNGLDAFFAGIDVLLFPSQWKESFGLTVREALARDVWVVATEGGGAAEAIEDGVNGTIIPLDGRAAPLRAAIEALLDNPSRVRGFRNPLKKRIVSYDEQAGSLQQTLMRVAAPAGRRNTA